MPLISKQKISKNKTIKASVSSELFAEIDEYCKWADISDHNHFLKEAIEYVFLKDKEWRAHKIKAI
jgi:hypothetical protein